MFLWIYEWGHYISDKKYLNQPHDLQSFSSPADHLKRKKWPLDSCERTPAVCLCPDTISVNTRTTAVWGHCKGPFRSHDFDSYHKNKTRFILENMCSSFCPEWEFPVTQSTDCSVLWPQCWSHERGETRVDPLDPFREWKLTRPVPQNKPWTSVLRIPPEKLALHSISWIYHKYFVVVLN